MTATQHKMHSQVYRILENGQPVYGLSGCVYPDGAARDGYQLFTAEEAASIQVGDMINVGTGYLGRHPTAWRKVTRIGEPFQMGTDGETQGSGRATVRRVYFEQLTGKNW